MEFAEQCQGLANGREHAQAEHVDLQQVQGFEVVLVPLDDRAVRHRGILDRHQLGKRSGGDDETADVLRKMTRKREYLVDEKQELPGNEAFRVYARRFETPIEFRSVVPPSHRFRKQVHEVEIKAQCLAHVANGAARPVGYQCRGERCPMPAVVFVDVLDDLLAPFVLEVDVDVRRFVALLGDEALEQEMHARRIHLRDSEAIADRGVGGGTASLAEDAALPGEADDVVNRQEEELVAEFADEFEFLLDKRDDVRRHAIGPAGLGTGFGKRAQVPGGSEPHRHQFAGILVAEFVQGKCATVGDRHGFFEHLLRIDPG